MPQLGEGFLRTNQVFVDRRIDALQEVPVSSIGELEQKLESLYRLLQDGRIQEITEIPFIEDTSVLVDNYVDETLGQLQEIPVNTEEEFQEAVENIYEDLASGTFPRRSPPSERSLSASGSRPTTWPWSRPALRGRYRRRPSTR